MNCVLSLTPCLYIWIILLLIKIIKKLSLILMILQISKLIILKCIIRGDL